MTLLVYMGDINYVDIMRVLNLFKDSQKDWLVNNTVQIQFTDKCDTQCSDLCGAGAGITTSFSFDSLSNATTVFGKELLDIYPYGLSNPPDYVGEQSQTIVDYCLLLQDKFGDTPYVSVALPPAGKQSKQQIIYELWQNEFLGRISLPFQWVNEDGKEFIHPERLESFLKFVINQQTELGTKVDRDHIMRVMPFDTVPHHEQGYSTLTGAVFTPVKRISESNTGIYLLRALETNRLLYLQRPITPATIGEYIAQGNIKNRGRIMF